MSKIFKKLAILILIGLAASSFVACQNATDKPKAEEPFESETTATLEVNNDAVSLILGEETYLDVTYIPKDGYALSFSSSDDTVVSVDENGKCLSKNLGQATITVSYSNGLDVLTDTATVVVELGNNIPSLTLIGVSNEQNQIALNGALKIQSRISFNGRFFEADDIAYTVSNSLGNIVDGVFTPTKTGEGTIEIHAEWCGVNAPSLTKTIPVSVINDVNLYVNEGKTSYELYTLERFGDYTYDTNMPFVVYGYENGSPVTPTVEIISGEEFIEYDVAANTISSKEKSGKAEVLISYTDIENKVYNETISIDILPSLADYKGETIEFSALDGDLPLNDIFQETITLKAAFAENGKELTIADNKVLGYEVVFDKNSQPEKTKLTVCTDTRGYKVSIMPYTKIIDEASDLSIFYLGDGVVPVSNYPYTNDCSFKDAAIFDGYYVLKADIDASTYTHRVVDVFYERNTAGGGNGKKVVLTTNGETPAQGLTGVFDGRGHTISNIKISRGGLFGGIVGGTVKNVAITNVSFDPNQITVNGSTTYGAMNDSNVLATFIDGGLVENVYIYVPTMRMTSRNDNVQRSALVSSFITDKTVMKNCIFRCDTYTYTKDTVTYDGVGTADKQYGSLMSDCRGTDYQWENVYVICSVPLANCTITTWRQAFSADASNQNPDTELYKTPFTGVERYDTQGDFEQATGNDYSSFNSVFWDILNGVPAWK